MNSEPKWLNIEQELYPQIYVYKILHVQSTTSGAPIHYPISVVYNSLHRQINATEAIQDLIEKYFNIENKYQIFMFDAEEQTYKCIGFYPFKQPILLKGSFVQNQFFMVRLQLINSQANPPKVKGKTDKTLKIVLQKVAQWRKIHIDSQKKVTLEEAANIVGISRNTLNDYYFQIKAAEKYGYNFQQNLEQPFQNLRKFVKSQEETQPKPKDSNPLPNILSKYQQK